MADTCLNEYAVSVRGTMLGAARDRELVRKRSIDFKLASALSSAMSAYVYQHAERSSEARRQWDWANELIVTTIPVMRRQKYNAMHYRALIEAGQGHTDEALDTLEAMYEAGWRGPLMGWQELVAPAGGDRGWFEDNPMFDSIRDEPRFITFVGKVETANAKMLEEYRAGLAIDDIIHEDLDAFAASGRSDIGSWR